jgi:1,4-dihydroxy-2-naphthoate octaprenyltransferase
VVRAAALIERHASWEGVWRLADPKITMASAASLLLGAAAAASQGPLDWNWLALTVLGIFLVEVAKNASGEIFDFDSGTDQAVASSSMASCRAVRPRRWRPSAISGRARSGA